MASTEGRDVVGRLREVRDAALAGESYWVGGDLMPVRISELEALLAVVEAARNADILLADVYAAPQHKPRVAKVRVELRAALARLYDGSSGDNG